MESLSFALNDLSIMKAIMRTTNILTTNLVNVNFHPNEDTSNSNNGIRMLAHEQMKIKTFVMRLPFFNIIPATGRSAYNGTAVITPKRKAIKIPRMPDLSPRILIILSLSTHISSKPTHIKTGVNMNTKLIRFLLVKERDSKPKGG